jgi:threonyl-tRNA synthetase
MNHISVEFLRHSAAHLLAHAIFELYPETLFGIGPSTKEGFFYDILNNNHSFKQEDLIKITERMKEIINRKLSLEHFYISKKEAREIFKTNPFKLDIIENQIKEDVVGIARQGNFIDLCKGGHVENTSQLEHFLLTKISGSYWRADKNNASMQRISGIIFETQEELTSYIQIQKDLEKYDHRVIGKKMELFNIHEEGPGFPFFYPNGMKIITALTDFMRNLTRCNGYQEIKTPCLLNQALWIRSGHYAHYKENMYGVLIDEEEYALKPMNCPGAFLVFGNRPRSYRELPLRLSEFGYVHRHELSGTLHGMTRVRAFTQDDAHIFCSLDQVKNEIKLILSLIYETMEKAKLKVSKIIISTKPKKAAGSDEIWELATKKLIEALEETGYSFAIAEGDGAFYGPKIGIEMEDNFKRVWSCGTIQLDFIQAENFDLNFINKDGQKERPIIIHQAMFGSLERFLAICLEHHRGKLPFWMAPVQVAIVPISQDQHVYAKNIFNQLLKENFRVKLFDEEIPLNAKLQESIAANDYLTLIIGKNEIKDGTLSIRHNYTNTKEVIAAENLILYLSSL